MMDYTFANPVDCRIMSGPMARKIDHALVAWKGKRSRMPLLIHGARQVGKTYSALNFGKRQFQNTAYFNMEDSRVVAAVFERDLNPERIIRELAALAGTSILKNETLIVFDEIQACERALTSLKYFCEMSPEYAIIATGSLLGIALNRQHTSFPVGKVDMVEMQPLDFEEFLWATGHADLSALIRESFRENRPLALHDAAMDLYRQYLVVGGMPGAVRTFVETQDFNLVVSLQKTLNDAYIADMAKYATPQDTVRIMAVWDSIPAQLAKENSKFQYAVIRSGARATVYELAMQWLKSAGMVNRCQRVSEGKLPLSAYADPDSFKLYMVDSGLLCAKFGLAAPIILHGPPGFDGFKGALAENYVMQALVASRRAPYYWSVANKAEVDFVIQDDQGRIIPLEVKSADNVRARSLRSFMSSYNLNVAIRISARNFGFENGIKSIPLYSVYCLDSDFS